MRHGEDRHLGVQGAEEGEPAAARFRRAQAAGAPGTRAPMNRWPMKLRGPGVMIGGKRNPSRNHFGSSTAVLSL